MLTMMKNEDIIRALKRLSLKGRYTFATAESCTGGLVGGAVTAEPGISQCYLGGVVSYANEVKRDLLGVPQKILDTVGAVSPACAAKMAEGVLARFPADFSVAVTGIAGPDGGTPEKPVGLVYVATAARGGATVVTRNLFPGDRAAVREATVAKALAMLLEAMAGSRAK